MNLFNKLLILVGGERILADYQVFKKWHSKNFASLFLSLPEFRYLCFYRLKSRRKIFRILLKPFQLFNHHNLFITCNNIGGGLYIEHGFSTIIACEKMGNNCMINQQVTIGWKSVIGNSVQIRAGAFIKDHVVIGDDVIIGAHAVVLNDIPAHSVVVGVPAKIIKTRQSELCAWGRSDSII